MASTVEIIALIIFALIGFGIVIAVGVVYVRRERTSNFKSTDPTMFYPNDALYGKDWQKNLTPEQQKTFTSAYIASLGQYNTGAE